MREASTSGISTRASQTAAAEAAATKDNAVPADQNLGRDSLLHPK
jgi:hypothetical protein